MKTNIKDSIMLIVILLVNNYAIAKDTNEALVVSKIDKRELQSMKKVMPDEFKDYEKQFKKDYNMSDAKLSLSLVSRANDLIKKNSDPNKQEDFNTAYCVAWQLAQDTMRKTKDVEVKKLILNNWNGSLKKDDGYVPYQVYAVREPNLFNDDFWRLLENTKKRHTISSICVMLLGFANKENAQLYIEMLKKKLSTEIDVGCKQDIQNTIVWIRYNISENKTFPGPAAIPPVPYFKNKPEK